MSGFELPPPANQPYTQFNRSQLPPPGHSAPLPSLSSSSSNSSMRRYRYVLEIGQQPIRARMCGFGDKDRRPISPPPLVRLRIYDENNTEVRNLTDVDINFFILSVDLWDAEGREEINLVIHPSNAASALSPASTPTTPAAYGPHPPAYPNEPPNYYQNQYPYMPPPSHDNGYHPGPYNSHPYPPPPPPPPHQPGGYGYPQDSYGINTAGNFTRNLIGSLCASAFRLTDTNGELGIWFVLQDLSVRTEGTFRLKFSFFNVGAPRDISDPRRGGPSLNTGCSRVLAEAMSDPFEVSKAKGFQGMVDASPLSIAFSKQGVRINVRNGHEGDDRNKNAGDDDDDDAD